MDKSLQVISMYMLVHIGLIFFLYPADIMESTVYGHWIPISVGVIVHFLIVIVFMKGLSYFPGKDIISIYANTGKMVVILFLIPIFFYFVMAIIISVRAYAEIIIIVFLSKTPLWSVMLLLLFSSCYLAVQGVEAIFRTGYLTTFLFFPLVLFVLIISFQNVDWYNFYPATVNDFSFLTKSSYLKSFFAIGGGFLFLGFIPPYFSFQRSKVIIAIAAIVPCFFLSVYIPILTFGSSTASNFLFPFVMAIDAINITWFMFDRMTIFFMLSMIIFIMLFISLVLWKSARIVHYFLPTWKPAFIIIFISILIFITCLFIPNWSDVDKLFEWNTVLRLYVLFTVPISIIWIGMRKKNV
ncbi:GerAB/ArcD/ProY family transporter [Radiobacillus sp. PE A8.2]|uniref:GerAB/ArcD/ProY family transporter n=1 Tax=Radiobacillus sp. PE A8.2 TaxID=3380349 RepID=UPI00388E7B70